jgi:hypothetical protein
MTSFLCKFNFSSIQIHLQYSSKNPFIRLIQNQITKLTCIIVSWALIGSNLQILLKIINGAPQCWFQWKITNAFIMEHNKLCSVQIVKCVFMNKKIFLILNYWFKVQLWVECCSLLKFNLKIICKFWKKLIKTVHEMIHTF